MARYLWEVKPPITRPDVFASPMDWEIGSIHAGTDDEAIRWCEKVMKKYEPQTLRLSCSGREIRTFRR
jgi:hypothetical protein